MNEAKVLRSDEAGIATLTLNEPARLNPLSDEMLATLGSELARIAEDRSVHVVILRGAGKAFCAGHDLKEMTAAREAPDGGRAAFGDLFGRCSEVMLAITRLPQPVIAQVHGIATAAGCQLVATCDLAVAADGTRFGVNGVNIGLFCSTPMVALTRVIGRKPAFAMLVTGDFIEAREAERLGLINVAVAEEDLETETRALAERITSKLGPVVRLGKRTFYEQAEMDVEAAYAHAGAVMAENMMRDDTAEGVNAFVEKRAPDWKR